MLVKTIEVKSTKCLCGEVLVFTGKDYETCPQCKQSYNREGKQIRLSEYIQGKYDIDLIQV